MDDTTRDDGTHEDPTSSDAMDDNSNARVDHELTSSGAAIRRRATDLIDTDAALASLRARTVLTGRSPAPAASMAAAASMTTIAPMAAAAAAATSGAVSTSTAVGSRSAVTALPSRSRLGLRIGVSLATAACIAITLVVSVQHGNRPTVERSTPLQIAAGPAASVAETTAGAITVTSPTLISATTTSRSCTYTDPAMRAISTARALTCPDGTRVFVDGVIVRDSAGDDWLCDEASGSDQQPCAAAGLRLIGSPRAQAGGFLGVKQGDTLLDAAGAATLTPATPPTSSLATVPATVPITGPIFPPATESPPTTAS